MVPNEVKIQYAEALRGTDPTETLLEIIAARDQKLADLVAGLEALEMKAHSLPYRTREFDEALDALLRSVKGKE